MALNTETIIRRCITLCQSGISKTNGVPTKVIDEVKSNINFIRNTIDTILDTPIDIFNALKNSANGFSIICGLGQKIFDEQIQTFGTPSVKDLIINDRQDDRYASFMIISKIIIGGETGIYSGVARGEIIELTGDFIPDVLGKSVLKNMFDIINNFDISDLGAITSEQEPNVALIIDLFKMLICCNICRTAIRIDFFSQEEMIEYIDLISSTFDNFINDLGTESADGTGSVGIGSGTEQFNNKDIYDGVIKMKQTIINELLEKSSGFVKSYDYNVPNSVISTLELAYNKYEDITRSDEIYYRNREQIKHPGFLPNGDSIRILNA
jgi:hypothetical protein